VKVNGWQQRQLGELAELRGRIGWRGLTAKEYTREGPLFLSVHSLNYGDFVDYRDAFHISQDRYDESPEIMLQEGDVLICKDGAGIGKVGIVGKLPGPTTINSSLLLIRSGKLLVPKFLYYCLSSPYFQDIVQSRLNGATTPHLYQRDITTFPIVLPPVAEQHRIVGILGESFAAIALARANTERKLVGLNELKKSLLHQAFSGQLASEQSIEDVDCAPIPFPVPLKGISPTDAHAGILAMAGDLHEKHNKLGQFGRVKAEKIAHMTEAWLGIDLGRTPVKDAAGPNDFKHLINMESRARKAGYFNFKLGANGMYRIIKFNRFDWLIAKTKTALGDRCEEVERLLQRMLHMDVQQAEIFATVYAAWNNLLLDGKTPTDEEIVFEARENWHPNKLKIERQRFFIAVGWLREKGMVPEGKGRRVVSKKA